MRTRVFGLLAGISVYALAAQPAAALPFTFFTPAGSTCGGEACAAEAVITTGAGSISVTLTDLLTPAQVLSAGQALSDLSFTLRHAPGTPGMKKSGPVPKENVAAVTVVAAVTPEKESVKLAGPITKGLNCPPVIEALAFVKLPPEGRIIWLG